MTWALREFPLAPCLASFPCFLLVSLQHPLVSLGNSVEIINFPGSEPSLRLVWAPNQPNRQNTGYFAGIPGKTRVYLEKARDVAGFLDFASDFAPDQLSDSGKLASFQNGAPNTLCFPWKFPETQSAGDPLFSFLFAGKPACLLQPNRPSARHGRDYVWACVRCLWTLTGQQPASRLITRLQP